jgi:CheY-like chemotaxis protein
VLVADDEEAVRRAVKLTLEAAGYRVVVAKDGGEAVGAVGGGGAEIDVALLDAVMPKCGGVAAAAEIKRLAADLPVVIMTGYTADDIRAEGIRVLPKPFTREDLLAMLDSVARA